MGLKNSNLSRVIDSLFGKYGLVYRSAQTLSEKYDDIFGDYGPIRSGWERVLDKVPFSDRFFPQSVGFDGYKPPLSWTLTTALMAGVGMYVAGLGGAVNLGVVTAGYHLMSYPDKKEWTRFLGVFHMLPKPKKLKHPFFPYVVSFPYLYFQVLTNKSVVGALEELSKNSSVDAFLDFFYVGTMYSLATAAIHKSVGMLSTGVRKDKLHFFRNSSLNKKSPLKEQYKDFLTTTINNYNVNDYSWQSDRVIFIHNYLSLLKKNSAKNANRNLMTISMQLGLEKEIINHFLDAVIKDSKSSDRDFAFVASYKILSRSSDRKDFFNTYISRVAKRNERLDKFKEGAKGVYQLRTPHNSVVVLGKQYGPKEKIKAKNDAFLSNFFEENIRIPGLAFPVQSDLVTVGNRMFSFVHLFTGKPVRSYSLELEDLYRLYSYLDEITRHDSIRTLKNVPVVDLYKKYATAPVDGNVLIDTIQSTEEISCGEHGGKNSLTLGLDYHDGNLLYNRDVDIVMKIDNEIKGFLPYMFDGVNFVDHFFDGISADMYDNLKQKLYSHVENCFEYSRVMTETLYANSLFLRTVAFVDAWSKPHRSNDALRRLPLLSHSIGQLNEMAYYVHDRKLVLGQVEELEKLYNNLSKL